MWILALLACGADPPPTPEPVPVPEAPAVPASVVVVIADDLGVDAIAQYADDPLAASPKRPYPSTPTVDALCSEGVRFRNVWATPVCSPTRAQILTGRYGFRTGIDRVRGVSIRPSETTLPQVLDVPTAHIGKWHLGHGDDLDGVKAPNTLGWDHFSGTLDNIGSYTKWTRIRDGETERMTDYATTVQVDDALAWWKAQPDGPRLLWVAFTAPHVPFHAPPAQLCSGEGTSKAEQYDLAVEAMDAELGRLLEGVGDDVTVIFLGDNGTPDKAVRGPYSTKRAKGSLYESGMKVPMCIRGPGIEAAEHLGPVGAVDVFATAVGLLGAEVPDGLDSVDLRPVLAGGEPVRDWVYTESNREPERSPTYDGGYALRDARYKYVRLHSGREWLFDLESDPLEKKNLAGTKAMGEVLERFRSRAHELRGASE